MTDNIRSFLYLCLGLAGLAIFGYVIWIGFRLSVISARISEYLIFGATGFILFFASLLLLLIAYAFRCSVVDEVFGTRNSATLIRSKKVLKREVRLRMIATMGLDDLNLDDDQRRVLFVADWLPWVCSVSRFHVVLNKRK